jgi:hypothetical protein
MRHLVVHAEIIFTDNSGSAGQVVSQFCLIHRALECFFQYDIESYKQVFGRDNLIKTGKI